MKSIFLETISAISESMPVAEWLEKSIYDELVEIDLNADSYCILSLITDKSANAPSEGRFTDLCQFALDHLVNPNDAESYAAFVDRQTMKQRLEQSSVPGVIVGQFRFKMRGGSWHWAEVCIIGGEMHGFAPGIVRLYTFDIQEKKNREVEKENQRSGSRRLYRNDLTNLLWERSFFIEAQRRLEEVNAPEWCLIAIDIDHFSLFNDWYGRDTGDVLLTRMGEELIVAERVSTGVAGYLGQDNFCLIAPYDTQRITNLYNRLSGIMGELTSTVGFKPVFGVCMAADKTPVIDLLDRAKIALEYAEADFKTDICLYEPEMFERDEQEYRILLDFQQGLAEDEFDIYLQPQCRISSGKIVGVEALVRWIKPDGTIVPPLDFIPALEKYGFITDLDCYVWEHVCANLRNWIDTGHTPIPASVNVSQDDFYNIDVADFFKQLVAEYEIPTSLLKIEITESAIAEDSQSVIDAIQQLREAGFTVLMDDFGSGYSSLNNLQSLNVDVIKLDAGFLRMDEQSKRKGIRIIESIVNMAKTMSMPIICEGVETQEQIDFLESLGCRYIQGYYFYRPMPVSEFERLIGDGTELDDRGFDMKANEQMRLRELLDQNVYSDAMLNSILGPVAIYLWRENSIDIIRFNEQFYEAVGVPDFSERLSSIEQFVPENDLSKMYDLFKRAMEDSLNGASDIVGFYRTDGSLSQFMMHMYYLGENNEGRRFYGSVRDVTETAEMQIELKLLSERLSTSVLFMRWQGNAWHFKVFVHGLADEFGLTQDQFQSELDSGEFLSRIYPEDYQQLYEAAKEATRLGADFCSKVTFENAHGQAVQLHMEATSVEDSAGDASYFVTLNIPSK